MMDFWLVCFFLVAFTPESSKMCAANNFRSYNWAYKYKKSYGVGILNPIDLLQSLISVNILIALASFYNFEFISRALIEENGQKFLK